MKKVKYNNPLVNLEEIISYIKKNYKVNYWITLKLPSVLKTTKLDIDEIKEMLYQKFINNLNKFATKENIKFILGVIEDSYLNDGYHAHVLCELNKEEHVISEAWQNALLVGFKGTKMEITLKTALEKEALSIIFIKHLDVNSDIIIDNYIYYMFKHFGLNKRHGYFLNDFKLIPFIETKEYNSFKLLNKDFGLNFVILIYAISLLFNEKLNFEIFLKLIAEQKEIFDKILKEIDAYLLEKKIYIFNEGNSSDKINDLIYQVSSELVHSDILFVLKPSFSFANKQNIIKEYVKLLKKKYINNNSYYDYILSFINANFKDYVDYANKNLLKWKNKKQVEEKKGLIVESKWEVWFNNLTAETYFENIVFCSVDWVLSQGFELTLEAYSQEYFVKKFKNIWSFYLNPLNKNFKIELSINDYFLLFKGLVTVVEKILSIKRLLMPVKFFKNDKFVTYYMWSASNNQYLKNILYNILSHNKENNKNFNLLNFKMLNKLKVMFGTFFVIPKNWVFLVNQKLTENYSGGYILNNIFKFSPFVHQDESFIGDFELEKPEDFINTLNLYQNQTLILNSTYITSKGSVISEDKDNISSKDRAGKRKVIDEMDKIRKEYKEIWLKEVRKKKFWYCIYIDGRGRIYPSGYINYQNDSWIRKNIQIYGKYNIVKKEEVIKKIEELNKEQKEMITKDLEEKKEEEKIMMKWLRYKDANTSCYQITTVIYGIKELYEKYFKEGKNKKEIYDYYVEIIKKYVEEKEEKEVGKQIIKDIKIYRKAWKRAIMTQIYGATKMTMIKYCKEGMKEEKLKIDERLIKNFINYIDNTQVGVILKDLKKYIGMVFSSYDENTKEIVWQDDLKISDKIKKTLEVSCFDRKMSTIYCKTIEEKEVISIYKKRMEIKQKKYDKEHIDIRKTIQAYYVNTVHFIDSGIAYKMIKTMVHKNKGILSIHDCFGTLLMEAENLEELYISIFKNEEKNLMIQNYYKNIIKKNSWINDGINDKYYNKLYHGGVSHIKKLIEERKKEDVFAWKVLGNSNLIKDEK